MIGELCRSAFCLGILLFASVLWGQELRLGTTYTVEDSGLLKVLVPAFERARSIKVRAVLAGTGQVLRIAEKGDVDVVFSHSPADEEKFVAAGFGVARFDVMYNDFVIVGPAADPTGIRGEKDAVGAFKKIHARRAKFVSRGDDSGTHKKEQFLWRSAGLVPKWPDYLSTGQGMVRVLLMAGELQAYTLCDRATFSAQRAKAGLEILSSGDPRLRNEYGVIAVNPAQHPHVNRQGAQAFVEWITSEAGQHLISNYRIGGEQVFFPGAKSRR